MLGQRFLGFLAARQDIERAFVDRRVGAFGGAVLQRFIQQRRRLAQKTRQERDGFIALIAFGDEL